MLETGPKDKLPKGWSYPVGAKILSSFLEAVPHAAYHPLRFCWRAEFWASKFAQSRATGEAYPIIKAHIGGEVGMFDKRVEPPTEQTFQGWTVEVYAVPADYRAVVGERLTSCILPLVKRWLETPSPITLNFGGYFMALFREGDGRIETRVRESRFSPDTQDVLHAPNYVDKNE
jgi:hypothetical protein